MTSEPLGFWQRLLGFAATHRRACAIFLTAASVAAALGLPRLTVDAGIDRLLLQDVADRQAHLEVTRQFGSDNRVFLYLRDEKLWSPAKLAALERLHDELQRLPFVERVDDLFTATAIRSADGEMSAQPLLAHAPGDDQGAELARAAILDHPIAVRNLVSADGKSLAIGIALREGLQGRNEAGLQKALEQVVSRARDEIPSLAPAGPLPVQTAMGQGILRELIVLGSLSAVLLILAVWGLCRAACYPAQALAGGVLGLLWTFGLMGLLGVPVTVLSVLIPPLAFALAGIDAVGLAFCRGPDEGAGDAIDAMIRRFGGPSAIAGLALVLGLAGQVLTGIGALGEFGLAMAFAAVAGRLATALLLPTLARVLRPGPARSRPGNLSRLLLRLASYSPDRTVRRRLLSWTAAALLAAAALVAMAPPWRLAFDPQAFWGQDQGLVSVGERLHDEIAGPNLLYITLDANVEGAFRDPANLRRLADIQAFIAKQGVFDRSLSLADVVSQANREASGGRSDAFEVPPTRKLVARYLVLHPPRDLEPYVSHDFRRANIVVRHNVLDSATLSRYLGEMGSAVAHYAGPSMTTAVVGRGVSVAAAAERLVKTEAMGVVAVLAAVLLAMALLYTSALGGLIAIALSAITLLAVLAAMRILEIPVGMVTAMAAFVSIAITMHGTSRLFLRYCECSREAASYGDAAAAALKLELAPMSAAVAVLVAVLSVLAVSGFRPLAQFGGLACAAASLAWAVNVRLAPVLMQRIRLVGLKEMLALSSQWEALADCPLFAGLSNYQIRKTVLISELREYDDGERLIEQGTVGRSMHVVVSGYVQVSRRGEEGNQVLAVLGPGEVFGEIGFVQETYRTADVRALGPVAALRFDHDRLKKDLVLFPHIMAKLNFNISGILGRRLCELVGTDQGKKAPVAEEAGQ